MVSQILPNLLAQRNWNTVDEWCKRLTFEHTLRSSQCVCHEFPSRIDGALSFSLTLLPNDGMHAHVVDQLSLFLVRNVGEFKNRFHLWFKRILWKYEVKSNVLNEHNQSVRLVVRSFITSKPKRRKYSPTKIVDGWNKHKRNKSIAD